MIGPEHLFNGKPGQSRSGRFGGLVFCARPGLKAPKHAEFKVAAGHSCMMCFHKPSHLFMESRPRDSVTSLRPFTMIIRLCFYLMKNYFGRGCAQDTCTNIGMRLFIFKNASGAHMPVPPPPPTRIRFVWSCVDLSMASIVVAQADYARRTQFPLPPISAGSAVMNSSCA